MINQKNEHPYNHNITKENQRPTTREKQIRKAKLGSFDNLDDLFGQRFTSNPSLSNRILGLTEEDCEEE